MRRHSYNARRISGPGDVAALLRGRGRENVENLWVVTVNGSNEVSKVHHIGLGVANSVLAHPREIFAPAICDRAIGIFLVHNHCSGTVQPSAADYAITRRVLDVAEIVGIPLIDHVIFSDDSYYSFAEHGEISK